MKTRQVTQYACDFCNKKKYSAAAMRKHEKHCTANPDRVCRMCDVSGDYNDIKEIAGKLPKPVYKKTPIFNDRFYDQLVNSDELKASFNALNILCPACKLAVLRQSGYLGAFEFDYKAEVKAYFDEYKEIPYV